MSLVLALVCSAQLHHHRNGPLPPGEDEQMAALDAHLSTLPLLDAGQMKPGDRELLQQRELDLSRAAAFYGLDISDSHWTYQQILCRSLPDHLMLSFQNDSAEHGASHFVAVVPANGEKVQVVTDYTHGLLPFHAAWEKSAAYQAFNHMTETDRGEHELGPESHWLSLGMCFVALTGRVPNIALPQGSVPASEALAKRNGSTPIILIDPGKEAEVRFSDVSDARQTGNWSLRFDSKGRLTKAVVDRAGPIKTKSVPMSPIIPPIQPE
ncbi:MAG: hypothetical protein QOH85_1224 [Acidobacteriaceae bacterium]|jgi:hypothetical protein|nr:hypothetical protein [Acidobacteriaceae bacterium]